MIKFKKKILFVSNKFEKKIRNPNDGIAWALKAYLANFRKYDIISARKHSQAIGVIEKEKNIYMLVMEESVKSQCSLLFANSLRSRNISIPIVLYAKTKPSYKMTSNSIFISGSDNIIESVVKFEEEIMNQELEKEKLICAQV